MKNHLKNIGSASVKLLTCLSLMTAGIASATTYTWTNSVGDKLLNTSVNWSPNGTPAAGDTVIWNGTATGNLVLTNTSGLADGNPGLQVGVLAGQTGSLKIVEGVGSTGRIRLNTSFSVDSGAGAVTFGDAGTPAFPLALGATGNGSIHGWTNNSANPVTINTNCFFLMGGGGSHTLNTAGSGNFIFNNTIQSQNSGGNLNLTVNGPGMVNLVGTPTPGQTFAGTYSTTVVNGGTLQLGGANALGTSTLTINGGSLDSSVASLVNAGNNVQSWNGNFGFTGTQGLNIGSGAVTMNASRIVTVSASTFEVDGIITGTGYSLTKSGAGTLVFGGANTYSGGTVVSNGVLKMANSAALGASGANLTVHGTLDINGNSLSVGNFSGNATGVIDDVAGAGFDTLTVSNSSAGTFAGVIKNTTGTLALTKNGSGALTLSGANTYSGNTTVSAGSLLVDGSIGSGAVTVATGTTFGGAGSVGGTVNWQSGSAASFSLTPTTGAGSNSTAMAVSGSVTLNNNAVTVNVLGGSPLGVGTYKLMGYNTSGSTGAFATGLPTYTGAGVMAGTASTISTSGGTVTLTVVLTGVSSTWTNDGSGNWSAGVNWDSNPYYPHVAGDSARLGVGSAYSAVTLDTPVSLVAVVFTNNNSFKIADAGNALTFDNVAGGGDGLITVFAGASNSISPAVSLNKNLTITTTSGSALALTNTVSNGTAGAKTVTINGAANTMVELSGINTYGPAAGSVGTTVSGGSTAVLKLDNANALGSGDLNFSGSTTVQAANPMTLANNFVISAGSAQAGLDTSNNAVTMSGVVSGAGSFAKNGAGTLNLSGANSFMGGASINAGSVKLLNANGLSTNGTINMGAGTTLDLNGFSPVLGALNSTFSDAVVDTLSGGSVALTIGQTNGFGTFAGSIKNTSGSLTLVKAGTGSETLTGTNTYTGGTTITAGTLQIGNGGATGTLGSGPLVDNGTLSFNLTGTNIFAQQITGTGAVNMANSALVLRLLGNNTFTGPINITYGGGGALWITNASALGVGPKIVLCNSGNNSLHLDGSLGNINVDSSISFQLSNGSGVLYNESGSNTISGSVGMVNGNGDSYIVVNNGFLNLTGPIGTVSGNNNRTLVLGGAGDGSASGGLTDGGPVCSLAKQDAGTWTLSGVNNYTGTTTVSGGTLIINADNNGNGGSITVNGGTLLLNAAIYDAGSSPATVASGATFGGTGTMYSSVTWQAGAIGAFTTSASGPTPMTVYNAVTLNNNQLTVNVTGGTPLPVGSYTLLTEPNVIYSITGSFASTPTITGAGITAGTKAFVTTSSTAVTLTVVNSSAWVNNGNGNWTTGANWDSNPNFPSVAGDFATLGVGSSLTTINLDASETIGGLAFTNANSFVISSGVNTLTLNNNGNVAAISVTAGTANSITAAMSLNDGSSTTINLNTNTALSIPANIGGSSPLTVTGNGVLTLSGNNSYGGNLAMNMGTNGGTIVLGSTTAMGSGTLTFSGGNLDSSVPNLVVANNNPQNWSGSFGFLGSQNLNLGNGSVSIASGGATVTVSSNSLTVGGTVSGTGLLTKAGSGSLLLMAANGATDTGGVRISGGTVVIGNDTALGSGTVEFASGDATIQSSDATARTVTNSINLSAGGIYAGSGNLTFSGPLASGSFGKTMAVSNAVTTFSGVLAGGTSQNAANTKTGPGTLVLSADNSALAKRVEVSQGTLALGSATAIGTGALTMFGGGLDSTVANLVNSGNNPQNWNGSFYFAGSQNLNMGSGSVTLNANTTITVSNSTLTVGGAVNGPGYSLAKAGAGTLVLSGANTYSNTTVTAGTLEIVQATLATNSAVSISNSAVLQLDFTTTNQVAGLVLGGSSQAAGVYKASNTGGLIAGSGSLLVVPLGPTGPAQITSSVSGSTLSLSWPSGQGWKLQMQTNALTTGLSTNWTYITDGSVNSTNITIDATKPTVFYRLTYP